jgi:hypothetical protein
MFTPNRRLYTPTPTFPPPTPQLASADTQTEPYHDNLKGFSMGEYSLFLWSLSSRKEGQVWRVKNTPGRVLQVADEQAG